MSDDEKGDKFDFSNGKFQNSTNYFKCTFIDGRPIRIPFQRPPPVEDFIDREEELAKLLDDLKPGSVVTICGPGGIGKSALASKAVWKIAPNDNIPELFPNGTVYYSFDRRTEVAYAYEHIVRSYDEEAQDISHQAALRALSGRQALLILEGTEQADDLSSLLQTRGGCAVLITSRRASDAVSDKQELLPMPMDVAVELLQVNFGREMAERDAAHGICEFLGGLPMAISLVGKYLSETGESLGEYLEWLTETPLEALDPDEVEDRLRSVPFLLERSLSQVGDDAVQVMALSGFFALSPFSQEAVAEALQYSTSSLRRALRKLTNFGMLRRVGDRYEVSHRLLYTYASQRLTVNAEVSNRLVSYFIELAKNETEEGLPGYLRLDADREHLTKSLEWCVEKKQWTLALELIFAIDTYLDVRGHWVDRVKALEMGVVAARQSGSRRRESICYAGFGNAYHRLGDIRKAIEYHERSLEIAKVIGDRRVESACYKNIGNAYNDLGNFRKAIEYNEKALEIITEIEDRPGESGCYMNLGEAYRNLGDSRKAMEYHERSLEIYKEIGDRSGKSKCYANLGIIYHRLGDIRKAIEYHEKALEINKEIGDRSEESKNYTNLGIAYHDLGEVKRAIEYHEKALEINKEIGGRSGESSCYGNLGNAYLSLGDIRKAIEYYERSLEICKEIGDRSGESACYSNLGIAYRNLGDSGKAMEYHERSLEIYKEIGDRSGESKCYANIGNICSDLGDFRKAIEYRERSLEIKIEIEDKSGESLCNANLGNAYIRLGDFRKAIEYHEKAVDIKIEIEDKSGESGCYRNLGVAYYSLGDFRKAIEYFERSLEIDKEIGDRSGESKYYDVLSILYNEMGDQEKANEYHQLAQKLEDENQ